MDPSTGVWVIRFNPSIAPGLPALLGERARQDPAGTMWFKIGPLDTDWGLAPGGGGVVGAPSDATYITQIPNAILTAEQALSLLGTGVLSSTTATGVVASTTFTDGSVPFGASSILGQDNANFFFDNAANRWGFGTNTPDASAMATIQRNQNTPLVWFFNNSNAGTGALVQLVLQASTIDTFASQPFLAMMTFGPGYVPGVGDPFFQPNNAAVSYLGNGNLIIQSKRVALNGDIVFITSASLERMRIDHAGDVFVKSLTAGGFVSADAVTGKLVIGSTAGFVPTTRTLTGTAPIAIDGVHTAADLSANRTFSIVANGITDALLRQGAATSVIGRSAGTAGNVADIAAASDGQILRRLGGVVGFGDAPVANITGAVATSRAINATSPIRIDGGASANLTADRTLSILDFVGSGASHAAGAVPDPGASPGDAKFLREDATWAIPAAVLQSFQFILKPAINANAALCATPRWLAPSQADGEDEADAWDERGWPFTSPLPASAFSFCVKVIDGDANTVDSGVWQWDFEFLRNGTDLISTATITSGTGPDTATEHDAAAFTDGDSVGVRVTGSQVSGTSADGWIFAFVTVTLRR